MEEQERDNFLSPNHKRLLTVATWAKYLAWVVFIVYIVSSLGVYFREQTYSYTRTNGNIRDFAQFFADNPFFAYTLVVEMLSVFLQGVVYYLVLKAVSLGLNMIVETDINYRERRTAGDEK